MSKQDPEIRTYGGWRHEVAGGLGRFSLTESLLLLVAGIVVMVVNWLAGWQWGIALLTVVGALSMGFLLRDKYGMNLYERKAERMRFNRARRGGRTRSRSGVLSPARDGDRHCRLPGVLGKTSLSEHLDAYGRRFGVVKHQDKHLTIVLAVSPEGERLKDQEDIDLAVARYGRWIASLSNEPGVVGASVTIETTPETGQQLRAQVRAKRAANAPKAAVEVVESVIAGKHVGARMSGWVSLSFDPARLGGKRAVTEIATRMPYLTQTLRAAGAGAVRVLDAHAIARVARTAYDPDVERLIESAAEQGQSVDISWEETGPVAKDDSWDYFRHDSGTSCSWVMRAAPRGTVQSTSLRRLLEARREVERKRVTLLYAPMDPARASEALERSVDKADNNRRLRGKRSTARANRDYAQAVQATQEEASGASIADFGMIITVTAVGEDSPQRIKDAKAAAESLAASSKFTMRPSYGSQGAAFAMGLPLGVMPHQQSLLGGV